MRPLTLDRAKPVLPVLNRPLLHWTLEMLASHGIEEVMINLHYLPRSVRAAGGDGRDFGLKVSYSFERDILGTGGGPRKVRRWIGDETLLLLNGDVVFDFDLTALRRRHERAGAPRPWASSEPRSAALQSRDHGAGRAREVHCRPAAPARGTVSMFTGVHILDPALLDRLPPGPSDTVRHLYAPLIAEGRRRSESGCEARGTISAALRCTSPHSSHCSHHGSGESGGGRSSTPRPGSIRGRAWSARWWARARSSRRAPRCAGACCGIA
jgi:NDP-sugar pyrophosphorylase family protein